MIMRSLPLIALVALAAAPAPAPRFGLPLACTIGSDCLVQNYVDADPSPAAHDFTGAGRTYDGHDGIDFRIASIVRERAGVAVLAAAAGVVQRLRNTAEDRLLGTGELGSVAGAECGNGLVIDHGGGWTSQYCHMAKGSIIVAPGQSVAAGAPLGKVGLSGATQFPHLHLTVRHNGVAVDPFAVAGGSSLWSPASGLANGYRAGAVLNAGFAAAPVDAATITEHGDSPPPRPDRASPAIVAFVLALGLAAGDIIHLDVIAGDGTPLAQRVEPPLARDKAQWLVFAGRKRPPAGWPAGPIAAHYWVERDGKPVLDKRFALEI